MHDTTAPARTRTIGIRRALVSGLVLASVCGAALPASSMASSQVINTYNVKVAKGILDKGSTVKAKATIVNGAAQQSDWWSQGTIATVVRAGVNKGYGKPYTSQGFRCTPVVSAWNANFTCKLAGADVPTTIKLTFSASWRH
jgi:dihydroxyacid dehydratase/phosphogluconate dehydratase